MWCGMKEKNVIKFNNPVSAAYFFGYGIQVSIENDSLSYNLKSDRLVYV